MTDNLLVDRRACGATVLLPRGCLTACLNGLQKESVLEAALNSCRSAE